MARKNPQNEADEPDEAAAPTEPDEAAAPEEPQGTPPEEADAPEADAPEEEAGAPASDEHTADDDPANLRRPTDAEADAEAANAQVEERLQEANERGHLGTSVDPTPREAYTVAGVTEDPTGTPEARLEDGQRTAQPLLRADGSVEVI